MWSIKKTCFVMSILFVCAVFLYPQEQKVAKIPLPTKPHKEDIVSSDLACRFASITAQKRFGAGVIGEPIIGYDLNGNIRAYIVPYRIGKSVFPTEVEIIRNLNEAKRLVPDAQVELARIRESSLKSKTEEIKFEKQSDRLILIKKTEWAEAEKKVEDTKNKCWGIGEYATIIVSARKDLVPILGFSNTLPYYFTYQEITEQMAKEALSADNVSLVRFYYGGNLDQIFEYESASGQKIWIAIFPPRVIKPGEIFPKELEVTEDEQKWIRQKWDEMLKEVQNEK